MGGFFAAIAWQAQNAHRYAQHSGLTQHQMEMRSILQLLIFLSILVAAGIIGDWFDRKKK